MRRSTCNTLPGRSFRPASQAAVPAFIETSLVGARAGLSDADATRRMASDFRDAIGREGGLDRDDLERLGYTGEQIDRLHRGARLLAIRAALAT